MWPLNWNSLLHLPNDSATVTSCSGTESSVSSNHRINQSVHETKPSDTWPLTGANQNAFYVFKLVANFAVQKPGTLVESLTLGASGIFIRYIYRSNRHLVDYQWAVLLSLSCPACYLHRFCSISQQPFSLVIHVLIHTSNANALKCHQVSFLRRANLFHP